MKFKEQSFSFATLFFGGVWGTFLLLKTKNTAHELQDQESSSHDFEQEALLDSRIALKTKKQLRT